MGGPRRGQPSDEERRATQFGLAATCDYRFGPVRPRDPGLTPLPNWSHLPALAWLVTDGRRRHLLRIRTDLGSSDRLGPERLPPWPARVRGSGPILRLSLVNRFACEL